MFASLVFDGGEVKIPQSWGQPREDQMKGTRAEQLMEVAGRGCYDSLGTGRGSGEYHKNLLFTQKHYSVAEHVHFTIEVTSDLLPFHWLGIPDASFSMSRGWGVNTHCRLTCNLRHVLEWPNCIVSDIDNGRDGDIERWQNILTWAAWEKCPNVFPKPEVSCVPDFKFVEPERDTEAFVSLFLEDSLTWSHEQVRHRGNISQRSGRFCDQTDRDFCVHPYLREYLDEVGYLSDGPEDGQKIFKGNQVDDKEAGERIRLGSQLGQHVAQSRILYKAVADRLQDWITRKGQVDKLTARKQARSAARYYLGSGLSTEAVYTCSIRHWRHIFNMRCNPAADQAIFQVMEAARELVASSRYGHML